MRNDMKRALAVLGAIAIGAGIASPVVANLPVMRISYVDLDTHSAEGRQALLRRITRAADLACSADDPRFLVTRAEQDACRGRTIERVTSDLEQRGVVLP
jgi:UrcA family protein